MWKETVVAYYEVRPITYLEGPRKISTAGHRALALRRVTARSPLRSVYALFEVKTQTQGRSFQPDPINGIWCFCE